jgi:hypothetical protein
MLLGGIIIILKQLPHAFGYDNDFEGDQAFYKMTEVILLLLYSTF